MNTTQTPPSDSGFAFSIAKTIASDGETVHKPLPMAERINQYSEFLANLVHAPLKVYKTRGNIFHEVSIEGHRFRGRVISTGDVWITKCNPVVLTEEFGVSLGAASIRRCPAHNANTDGEWWICKYSSREPCLDLENMTEEGRNALAYQFGLPLIPTEELLNPSLIWSSFVNGREGELFYLSPAFVKLVDWAKRHPRSALSSSAKANHLRQWLDVAKEHSSFSD